MKQTTQLINAWLSECNFQPSMNKNENKTYDVLRKPEAYILTKIYWSKYLIILITKFVTKLQVLIKR